MKKLFLFLCMAMLAAGILSGCGGGGVHAVSGQNAAPAARIVSTTPSDGSSNVATDTVVTVEFSTTMHMNSVQDNFHVYEGENAGGNPMRGNYSWNDMQTMMSFYPDSAMGSGATHTIHMGSGMMSQSGGMMMDMSGNMMDEDMYLYFKTR